MVRARELDDSRFEASVWHFSSRGLARSHLTAQLLSPVKEHVLSRPMLHLRSVLVGSVRQLRVAGVGCPVRTLRQAVGALPCDMLKTGVRTLLVGAS